MDDYPGNSRSPLFPATPKKEEITPEVKKKVERVTVGDAIRRKPSLGQRFLGTFIQGDARRAWGAVLGDVLIPAAKDMAADAISQGFERLIYGEIRSRSRRTSSDYGVSHISYNRYGSGGFQRSRQEERRPMSRQARASHDFDEIILGTRAEAEEVVDRLFDLVARYESATVADLYELVGIKSHYTDEKWGWTDIRGTSVTRVRSGYLLNVPKPEPLD